MSNASTAPPVNDLLFFFMYLAAFGVTVPAAMVLGMGYGGKADMIQVNAPSYPVCENLAT